MKRKEKVLALLLSAVCAVPGVSALPVQAEVPAAVSLEEGLTGYWNFDGGEPMANLAPQASLTASLSGSAVSVQPSEEEGFGNVLRFGERQGESAKMTVASGLNSGGGDFSVSLWVNNSPAQNGSVKTIVLQQTGNGRTLLYRQNGQYVTYISAADVTMGSSTGSDVWEHLVLVKTGEPSAYEVTLYVNGEEKSTQDLKSGAVNAVTDLLIGAHKNAGDTGQFVGDVDELRLYNRALSPEEVQALYAEYEDVVLEQQIQGIRDELSALIQRAEELCAQGETDPAVPEREALAAAVDSAKEVVDGADATAITAAMEALETALNEYVDVSLTLTVDPQDVSREIDDGIFGINHRYAFNGYGSFDPETMQIKEEFSQLYTQAGFGSLRYPGGTISNLFNWKETIGPKEERVAQIHGFYNNSGQHGIAPNFGLDEAAEFTREHDSELVYVYALARGDADDAADLIEYLNAEVGSNPNGGTAWAEVRAANGHEAPYNVRYFEIGNEMNQGGADGTTAQTYWIDDVQGGALSGYINGGTASFAGQYVVAKDDWNQTASRSDGTADQTFYLRYARVERDEKAEDYASFTAVNKGSVKIYVGGTQWTEVSDLETAGADAQVYSVDYKTGAVRFGDGTHGAIPQSGQQITADYSVDRDGFVQISQAMRSTMDQINEYNSENGLAEKEIHIYSSFETEGFVNQMHERGNDDLYDGLTIHPYSGTPAGGSSTEESRETFYYDAMLKGDRKAADVENYVTLMQKYDQTKVPVISEYGIFRSTDTMVRSQTHALYIARAIMEYVRLGSPYIQKHCLVDWYSEGADSLGPTQQAVIQAVSTGGSTADGTGEFRFFSTPSARVFEMLNGSFGDQVISSSLNYEQQLDNGVDQYSVMTSKDAEGNIYAAIVNLNLEGGNKMNIRIDGQDLTGRTMEVQSLSGDSFYAENTLDQPDNVKIDRSEATISGADAAVTLAPHSFTIVKIHAAQDEGGSGTEDPDPEVPTDPDTGDPTDPDPENPGGEDPDVEDPGTEKPGGEDPDAEDPGTGDPAGSGKPSGTEGSQNTGVSADAGKDTDVPATGEGRSLAMFAVLCILAGTGTVYLGYRRMKNGYN